VAGTLLLVALALTTTAVIGTNVLRGNLEDRVDEQLRGLAAYRKAQEQKAPRENPPDADDRPWPRRLFYPSRNLMFSELLNPDGTVYQTGASYSGGSQPRLPPLNASRVAALRHRPFTVSSTSASGPQWRVIAIPVPGSGRTKVVAIPLSEVDKTVSQLLMIDAIVGGIVLLVLGVAGYALVRVSMRPLVQIEDTADTIAGGDLSQRVPDSAVPAEVRRLGLALNGMLAQIESAFRDREESEAAARASEEAARASEERMRRFVADASHELRTPLTSIRGFAELYRQETGARGYTDPEAAKVLSRIEESASRMGLLVEDLLLLARMDQARPLEEKLVDLLSLAAEAVIDAQALAPDREIDLVRTDGADTPVTVIGDEARLRQVLSNLITNALTHTPPGTPFRVGVGMTPRGAVLEVADEGPGLPRRQAERVFERFYRAEQSRSRAHGGSGLGLSIVTALVKAHGGTMELETEPGRGALFRAVFPVTQA
jgi:two-component system OmpR family sensor kinase